MCQFDYDDLGDDYVDDKDDDDNDKYDITSLLVPACPARLAMLTTCPDLLAIISGRKACYDYDDDDDDDDDNFYDDNDEDNDSVVDTMSRFACDHIGKECLL